MKTIYYISGISLFLLLFSSCTAEEMPQSEQDQIADLTLTPIDPPIIIDRPK